MDLIARKATSLTLKGRNLKYIRSRMDTGKAKYYYRGGGIYLYAHWDGPLSCGKGAAPIDIFHKCILRGTPEPSPGRRGGLYFGMGGGGGR